MQAFNVAAQPRKSWNEVLLYDRKKLGMDTDDPQNLSEWRGRQKETCKTSPTLRREQQTIQRI